MMRLGSACIAACVAGVVLGLAGCGKRAQSGTGNRIPPERSEGERGDFAALRRDLEATVLENYLQLTVSNEEVYADGIARNREITSLGLGPGDVVSGMVAAARCGEGAGDEPICKIAYDRLPLRGDATCGAGSGEDAACPVVHSKNLELHLSRDGSVAWILDELSYRVPHEGREAAIPLRFTAVFVRDLDRWLMVMEHLSYPLPTEVMLGLAASGALARPRLVPPYQDDEVRARLLARQVLRRLNANGEALRYMARVAAQKRDRLGHAWVYQNRALLWPDPRQEFHDVAFYEAPSLADAIGPGTRVTIPGGALRVVVAESGNVAWLAANLRATRRGDAAAGVRATTIDMRATAVFELDDHDWNLMQLHVSVPVTADQLEARVLGAGLDVPVPERLLPDMP